MYFNYIFSKTLIRKPELPEAASSMTLSSLFTPEILVEAMVEIPVLIHAGFTRMKTAVSPYYIIKL